MIWSLLADLLVLIHFAFTAFVIFGGFLAWRWRRVVLAHLPALLWGCWVEVSHSICPLTPLENQLRHLGGQAGYSEGFLAHYLLRVLYPPGLTSGIQWLLAGMLVLINVAAYAGYFVRQRKASLTGQSALPENSRASRDPPVPR